MSIPKSRSLKRYQVRTPSGESVTRLRRKKAGIPTCPTGRPLIGTARGTKTEVKALTKTQRRPSRPYGGVLSSPALRAVMQERVQKTWNSDGEGLFTVGSVCLKTAGRDAGKLCVITEVLPNQFVKVEGDTRPRTINMRHLEPIGKHVELKKGGAKEALAKLE